MPAVVGARKHLPRRDAANFHGQAVGYARRFKATATITKRARIPTTHGHTGALRSMGAAAVSAVGVLGGCKVVGVAGVEGTGVTAGVDPGSLGLAFDGIPVDR